MFAIKTVTESIKFFSPKTKTKLLSLYHNKILSVALTNV